MAQKRMFDKTITNSDDFIDMPDSSQNLYFHLSMNADDDGFVNNWKSILRMTGHKEDDLKVLIAKSFIIPFESGVVVIKHWRINNYLRKDRYTETNFKEEKQQLFLDDSMVYQMSTNGVHRLDKIRLDEINNIKENIKRKKFVKPTPEEIHQYCLERNNFVNWQQFYDFYESKGWKVGNQPMKDWKACVRTWERKDTTQEQNVPEWFDKKIEKEKISTEKSQELEELIKKYK